MKEPNEPPDPVEWQDVPSGAEQLDEDELGGDPLDEDLEPGWIGEEPGWTAADRHGTTPNEQLSGEAHGDRLAEEEPDMTPEPPPEEGAS